MAAKRKKTKLPVQCWKNNHSQFARLLAELACVGLTKPQYKFLRESMNCTDELVNELLERASCEWDTRIKNNDACRISTPHSHLREYCGKDFT